MVSQNRCKRKPNFLKLDCTWTELQYLLHDSYFTCILSHNLKLRYKTYVSSSKESDKFDHYSFQLELNFLMPFNHISRWPTDISSCFWSGYTKTMKMNPVAVAMIAVWSSVAVVVVVVVIGLLCSFGGGLGFGVVVKVSVAVALAEIKWQSDVAHLHLLGAVLFLLLCVPFCWFVSVEKNAFLFFFLIWCVHGVSCLN